MDESVLRDRSLSDELASREYFTRVWRWLSRQGICDEEGGAEHRRVLTEWEQAGRPMGAMSFIRERANLGPGTAPEEPQSEEAAQ